MAKVTIGGKEYLIPELNFVALERAWPFIEDSMLNGAMTIELAGKMMLMDPMKAPSAGLSIIAAGLMEADDFKAEDYNVPTDQGLDDDGIHKHVVVFLKKKLKASELPNIAPCIDEIIKEAGLETEEGENKTTDQAESPASPSPETAPDTSSSLSQPELKEEAGTQ